MRPSKYVSLLILIVSSCNAAEYSCFNISTGLCCGGYIGSDCLPDCTEKPCLENFVCSTPNTCICQDGWKGDDCTIDIDECTSGSSLCEVQDSCINTKGSYECSCGSDYVLALDGRRCLGSVTNITVSLQSDLIVFNYSLPNDTADGVFHGVFIECNSTTHSFNITVFGSIKQAATVTSFIPFTNYTCYFTPSWLSNGVGKESSINITTLQTIPDGPPVDINLNVTTSYSVLISWEPPESPNGIITNYTLYIDYTNESSVDVRTVSRDTRVYLLQNLHGYQRVAVAISASTINGAGPVHSFIFARTLEDIPGPVTNLNVTILSDYAANVSWHPPDELNGIIINYHFSIVSLTADPNFQYSFGREVKPHHNFFISLYTLNPFIPYFVTVIAETVIGRGDLSPATFFTKMTLPASFPMLTVHRPEPDVINVKWKQLKLEELNGFLSSYHLIIEESVYNCTSVNNPRVMTTNITSIVIDHLIPSYAYCLSIAASTAVGIGPFSPLYYVPIFESSLFQLHFKGFEDCNMWINSINKDVVKRVINQLANLLNTSCLCDLEALHFSSVRFLCDDRDSTRVIIQGRISGTSIANSSSIIETLQNLVHSGNLNSLNVNGTNHSIDRSCSVHIYNFDSNITCIQSTTSVVDNPIFTGIIAALVVILIALPISVVLIILLIRFLKRHKMKPKRPNISRLPIQTSSSNTSIRSSKMQPINRFSTIAKLYEETTSKDQMTSVNGMDSFDVQ